MTDYIYKFLKNFDYSYIFGAGLMYTNDQETRDYILNYATDDNTIMSEVNINEYPEIQEFIPEIVQQSKIYKFQKYNSEPLFVHVY